jgi:hypothetical protein
MKKYVTSFVIACVVVFIDSASPLHAQGYPVMDIAAIKQQATGQITNTMQHVSRLAQLVAQATNAKNIFDEVKTWYDHLKSVAVTVQTYKRIADCVGIIAQIGDSYVNAFTKFRLDPNFKWEELEAIAKGFDKLISGASDAFGELKMGIGKLSGDDMSLTDAERLKIIDDVHKVLQNHLGAVNQFTQTLTSVSYIRSIENKNTKVIEELYGFKN